MKPVGGDVFRYGSRRSIRVRLTKHLVEAESICVRTEPYSVSAIFEAACDGERRRSGFSIRRTATHVLGSVERLSRLELVWETLRLALAALINADAKWVNGQLPSAFVSEYIQKRSDYRMSKGQAEAMQDVGRDSFWLLSQIELNGQAAWQDLPAVTLRQVLEQQFDQDDGEGSSGVRPKANIDVGGDVNSSPHDPLPIARRTKTLNGAATKRK